VPAILKAKELVPVSQEVPVLEEIKNLFPSLTNQ
jgi:hypothetical protein